MIYIWRKNRDLTAATRISATEVNNASASEEPVNVL